MSDKYWEIVEYECQDGKCLMIHNISNDSKLGALSLDYRDIGEAIVEKLNEQQATINKQKEEIINSHIAYVESLNEIKDLKEENEKLRQKLDFYLLDEFEWKEKYGD